MFSSILRSIVFYRRINIVVALAVAISTAVIGGAMIVGDSVRYSLRQMTRQRLGDVTHVVHGRFVREDLASEVARHSGARVAPAILVTAGMELQRDDSVRRAGSVSVTAVDSAAWSFFDTAERSAPVGQDIVLGFRTAGELDAQVGDTISMWVELPTSIPRDSLLGEREDVSAEIQLTVSDILPEDAGASRFTLNPGQQLPWNAFVSLPAMQERLGLEAREKSRRNPIARPATVNTLLIHQEDAETGAGDGLSEAVRAVLSLDDLAVRLRTDSERGYVSVESDRMILEQAVSDGVVAAADQLGLRSAPTLVYLMNELAAADRTSSDERYSMYSIVAGLPLEAAAPLGTFSTSRLADDEIVLSQWLADDLEVQPGDQVLARWHEVGSHGDLPEVNQTFTVVVVLADDDSVSLDPGLTPTIPGVTDVESFDDWDQPFEMEMGRITGRDDAWWADHRATPKAFVSLAAAQKLWKSRYGTATSVRIAADVHPLPEERLPAIADQLAERIPRQCDLASLGLVPLPILENGLQAAVGANDFTQLFAGFSFFLILSAIILSSLMFRLGVQQRVSQAGLLYAAGCPASKVRWFFLGEGLIVAAAGAVVGTAVAVGFAKLMIYGLTTWWIGAIGTQFLKLDIIPLRLLAAGGISLALAGFVIRISVARLKQSSVRDLLNGQVSSEPSDLRSSGWVNLATGASLLCGLLLPAAAAAGALPSGEAFSGLTWDMVAFFLGGTGCLAGGLLLLRRRLQVRGSVIDTRTVRRISGFAMANAARSPWRSLLTTALIASATFLIVAVAAGHRNPLSETPDIESGNGGFRLVAESSQPVLRDMNQSEGRVALNVENAFAQTGLSETSEIYSFAVRPGEDASCVNLYQTQLPTLLGASEAFIERGGFRFADTRGDNPWTQLQQPPEMVDGLPEFPVIGDMNTLMYSLKKGPGDTILFPDETSPSARLRVVGMLDGSLFQGVLILSRANLQTLDPDVSGFQYFLAEAETAEAADELAELMETQLNAYGMDTEPVGERLAGFLAVQNTYLSTFQLLGGLGLLVGVFGLAVVTVRNVVERRGEIAMLRAVGFTGFRICRLIVTENCLLLLWGMLLGAASALLAMLPHLLSSGGDLPWESLGLILVAVAGTGLLASVSAVRRALRVSIRETLAVDT